MHLGMCLLRTVFSKPTMKWKVHSHRVLKASSTKLGVSHRASKEVTGGSPDAAPEDPPWLTTWTALTHRAQPASPRSLTRCILTVELAATTHSAQMSARHRLVGQKRKEERRQCLGPSAGTV